MGLKAFSPICALRTLLPEEQLPSDLGHWLAGFADGEGCFSIARRKPKNGRQTYGCSFAIKVRADDRELIESLPELVGIGSVSEHRAHVNQGRTNNPSIRWDVWRQDECLALVAIFDRYPLRSKKARDFAVWASAVRYWTSPNRTRVGLTGRGGARWFVDQQPMEALHAKLSELRGFHV